MSADDEPNQETSGAEPHSSEENASDSDAAKKRAKVVRDPTKEDHTSHWDLDYLPKEEVDRILGNDESEDS